MWAVSAAGEIIMNRRPGDSARGDPLFSSKRGIFAYASFSDEQSH